MVIAFNSRITKKKSFPYILFGPIIQLCQSPHPSLPSLHTSLPPSSLCVPVSKKCTDLRIIYVFLFFPSLLIIWIILERFLVIPAFYRRQHTRCIPGGYLDGLRQLVYHKELLYRLSKQNALIHLFSSSPVPSLQPSFPPKMMHPVSKILKTNIY